MKEKIISRLKSFDVLIALIIIVSGLIVIAVNPMSHADIKKMPVISEMDSSYAALQEIAKGMAENKTTECQLSENLEGYWVDKQNDGSVNVKLYGANNTFLDFTLSQDYELTSSNTLQFQKFWVLFSQIIVVLLVVAFYTALVSMPLILVAYIGKLIYSKKKIKKTNV